MANLEQYAQGAAVGSGTASTTTTGITIPSVTAPRIQENPVLTESTPRSISITPALNGWIVQVGCKILVFNDINVLTAELNNYYANPQQTAKRFLESATNKI